MFHSTLLISSSISLGWASFTDFILALYPIYFFWDLHVDWKTKLGLICLFLGGTV